MKKSIKCDCGGRTAVTELEILPGLFSEGYKCQKCGDTEFTEEQMRSALKKKEKAIKLMVTRKLGRVGGSLVLRIPNSATKAMNLKSGKEVRILLESKKLIIEAVD
ncbi:MAG: hypothetical protein J4469_05105 [Candidatus Aenigmarchaeota archaeon]|nr:hypothetical protein [Candidatus Aenigmarchaeota archaeon]